MDERWTDRHKIRTGFIKELPNISPEGARYLARKDEEAAARGIWNRAVQIGLCPLL